MDLGTLAPEARRLCAKISGFQFSWSLRAKSALWVRGATIRQVAGAPAFLLVHELLKSSKAGSWVCASAWMKTWGCCAFECPPIYTEDQRRPADTSEGPRGGEAQGVPRQSQTSPGCQCAVLAVARCLSQGRGTPAMSCGGFFNLFFPWMMVTRDYYYNFIIQPQCTTGYTIAM